MSVRKVVEPAGKFFVICLKMQNSKCMGHSSVLTTFNTYAGIMDADNQAKDFLDTLYPSSMNQCREERVVNV